MIRTERKIIMVDKNDPTPEEIEAMTKEITSMTREEMCQLWRFAPVGHLFFQSPLYEIFNKRFKELGGFSPEISKKIGWD